MLVWKAIIGVGLTGVNMKLIINFDKIENISHFRPGNGLFARTAVTDPVFARVHKIHRFYARVSARLPEMSIPP